MYRFLKIDIRLTSAALESAVKVKSRRVVTMTNDKFWYLCKVETQHGEYTRHVQSGDLLWQIKDVILLLIIKILRVDWYLVDIFFLRLQGWGHVLGVQSWVKQINVLWELDLLAGQ